MCNNDIKVQYLHNTPIKMTLEGIEYEVDNIDYIIPRYFFYDGMSVPFFLRFLDDGRNERDILAHDYFYSKLADTHNQYVSRKKADLILFDNMRGIKRYIIYLGLRLFGWIAWKKDRNYKKNKKIIKLYMRKLKKDCI